MPSIAVPKKAGNVFGGYFTEPGGAGTQYYTDQGKSVRAWQDVNGGGTWQDTSTAVATLYAKWTRTEYTSTFNLNGGHFESGGGIKSGEEIENPNRPGYRVSRYSRSYNVEDEEIDVSDPVRKGYSFAGWNETVANPNDGVGSASSRRVAPKGFGKW